MTLPLSDEAQETKRRFNHSEVEPILRPPVQAAPSTALCSL